MSNDRDGMRFAPVVCGTKFICDMLGRGVRFRKQDTLGAACDSRRKSKVTALATHDFDEKCTFVG